MEGRVKKWVEDNSHDSNDGSGYGYGAGSGFGADHGCCHGDGAGSGYGSNDGSGFGDCYGDCYGSGDGSGYGAGCGDGAGYGASCGCGTGSEIASFDGRSVFYIDNVPTIIRSVKGNVAIGAILHDDFSESPCFVAKGRGYFSHGTSLREAVDALRKKIFSKLNTDEAIAEFVRHFSKNEKYAGREFFEWHHYLTGSCLAGRAAFVRNRGINLEEKISVGEFIALCENDYGGEIISRLKECYCSL